ncbi:MAG TPA: hypothetical protein VG228_05445 [Solirubrobacteraceae bacterium]|jgi:hypothetical protein|nr:hypothetical protein [Solirubrobacteraceae bacterium]
MSPGSYAEVIADIARGARLHYENAGSPDPDLDLLLGDQSYASGLAKLATLGDIEETARLADLISRVAQLHANGESATAREVLLAAERRLGNAGVGEQLP